MADNERQGFIWLEVANVRLEGQAVEIQVKGDRADREAVWWQVNLDRAVDSPPASTQSSDGAYRTIAEGLDKKRTVLAKLTPEGGGTVLRCTSIRIQYAESNSR